MAGDVWRWCQVHQKWLQDANVRVTQSGLQNDRAEAANQGTRSSRSFAPPDCVERMAKRPSGIAAASSRWQDDGRTLDPVPPNPRYNAGPAAKSKHRAPEAGPPSSALRASVSQPRSELGLGLPNQGQVSTDVENVWPKSRTKRPVKWLFAETPMQNNTCREEVIEGENWVTIFSSNPVRDSIGGGASRFGSSELHQVLREFEKCGNIVERVVGPDGANWVQIQYQSSREAGQALMKSGLRLKGGVTVLVRSLDQRQRKQLLLETISRTGTGAAPAGSSVSYLPYSSSGPRGDPETPKEEEQAPPKSSVSKFVDLVFDCERNFQISPAGYIIPIRFEPGLYKELFKSQVHRCDAFVTPLCDPAASQPLYFEYPRKSLDPCEYAQSRLEELRNVAGDDVALLPCSTGTGAGAFFHPPGAGQSGYEGGAWRGSDFSSDSQQRLCGCWRLAPPEGSEQRPEHPAERPDSERPDNRGSHGFSENERRMEVENRLSESRSQ